MRVWRVQADAKCFFFKLVDASIYIVTVFPSDLGESES